MIATSSVSIINVDDGQAYALQPSNSVIIMEEDGDYKPSQLSFQSVKLKGTDNPSSYSGRFKIEKTSDETNWTTEYTSSSDESSITYNMPSTIEEKTPYTYRPTGNGNNVGSKAFDTIVGGTVVWNQLIRNGNFADGKTNWTGSSAILTVTDGVARCTLDGDAWNNDMRQNNVPVIDGHIYLIGALVRQSSTNFTIMFRNPGGQGASYYFRGTEWTRYASFIKVTSSAPNGFALSVRENGTTLTDEWFEAQNINCFDLTQMFGSAIADYIYSLEQSTAGAGVAWFKKLFPKPYYAYNAGELLSVSNLQSHDMVGFNTLNTENAINATNVVSANSGGAISIKDVSTGLWSNAYLGYCDVIAEQTYEIYAEIDYGRIGFSLNTNYPRNGVNIPDFSMITPNASPSSTINYGRQSVKFISHFTGRIYMFFCTDNNISAHKAFTFSPCVHLVWDGERDGEYEPYKKWSYPLDDSLTLRGIPKLDASNSLYYDGDTYESDGTVTRRYGVIKFEELNQKVPTKKDNYNRWILGGYISDFTSDGYNKQWALYDSYPAISDKAVMVKEAQSYEGLVSWAIYGHASRIEWRIRIPDTYTAEQALAFANTFTLVYPISPTTETAEPYVSPQIVDRYGTEEYVTDSIVPVGHETKYTSNISSIRCSLYASGGTTTLLDQQIIPVVNDAESAVYMTKQIEEYRLSDSSTSITGSGDGYDWAGTMPTVPPGKYLWKRLKSYFSNGSIAYSDAVCDVVTSGLVFDVDRNSNAITSKVWESDITTKINQYDGSTGAAIRKRVSQTETNISGITSRVSDVESETDSLGTRMTTAESNITQNANNITTKVSKDGVISSINQSAEAIQISASKVDLIGNVTFSMLDSSTQNTVTKLTQNTEQIIGTQTSATYAWTGVSQTISELYDGLSITYLLPRSVGGSQIAATYTTISSGATTNTNGAALNLTLKNGTTTGNIPVWYMGVTRVTSHFGYGSSLRLVYHENLELNGAYRATGWWIDAQYNSDTVDNRIVYFTGKTGSVGIWGGSLFMRDSMGKYQNICTASDGTVTNASSGNGARTVATTKLANTHGFEVGSPIWYTTTSYNANSNISGTNVVYSSMGNVFDSRYAFNTTLTANNLTPYANLYLVGTINSTDGLFYLDSTWWTQTATDTSKVYILVGGVYDSTTSYCRITLYEDNKWLVYKDGKLQEYNKVLANNAQSTANSATSLLSTWTGDATLATTTINGGYIKTHTIESTHLATDAIMSSNYQASSDASSPYSATGTYLNLTNGNFYTPNFGIDNVHGEAYLNGEIIATSGSIGSNATNYWEIGNVQDYNMTDSAVIRGHGTAYIQSGYWQLSNDKLNTQYYDSSQSSGVLTYYNNSGTYYDVGQKIPTNFAAYNVNDTPVVKWNKAWFYGRKYTGDSVPSFDSDWTYFFEVDSNGNVTTAGDIYEGGVKLSEKYAAITDVGSAYLPKTGGTITGNLTVNGNFTTNLMIQTNLASTSAAQLTGNANATVTHGVTGTLGVGNGGTGQTSAKNAANAFMNALDTGSSTPVDADYYISQYVAGGAKTTTYHRRPMSALWNYIKGKIDSVYDITGNYRTLDNNIFDAIQVTDLNAGNIIVTGAGRFTNGLYGDLIGNADTATTAATADKVGSNLVILLNGGTTEGTNKFTYNGSATKNVNITKSGIGLGNVENTALSTWAGSANLTTTKVGTLAAAAAKGVDTSISASSTSANLPTSAAVAAFVESKGYVTSSGVTSVRVQATGPVVSSVNTAQSSTLNTTISLADGYGDTKNPYGTKTKNYVLAGPTTGSAAAPTFRALVADDIPTLTPAKAGLGNVTNDKQVKGLSSGTTSGNLVSWGANGYTVADSGIAVSSVNKTVKSLASNNDGKIVLTYLDDTTSDPIEVKIIGSSGSSVSYADALNVNGAAVGGAEQPVFINNQGKPKTTNKIPKLNNGTTGGTFYAPTGAGTSGQVLTSSGGAPSWTNQSSLSVGTAVNVSASAGTANATRHVWFSDNTTETKRVYDDSFMYNPSTNTLTVTNVSGNASSATKATQDSDGNTIKSTYLKLSGGTLTNPNNILYNASQGSVVTANAASVLQSPIPKYLWHDLWGFCKATTPKYYTTTDGSTWTEGTLEKRFFAHLEAWGRAEIIKSNGVIGSRWEWDGGGFAYCSGAWLVIGVAYANPIAKFDVLLEESADTGESGTWTTLCSSVGVSVNQQPVWIKTNQPSKNNIRLTITRNSGSDTNTALPIVSLRWLSYRWGNQGRGQEYEYPYTWDGEGNITAKGTFTGTFSGNATSATSATKATQDGDGAVISSTYLKRSGGTMTGTLKTNGTDIILGATGTGSSPNDSGDLVWQYGNGTEKMRLYSSDTYTEKHGIAFRQYDENQNQLYNGKIPLADGTDASGTWGISITGSATKATQDSDGNAINTTYMKKSGGTFTGDVTGTVIKASSYLSANSGSSGTAGGLLLWGNNANIEYGITFRTTDNQFKHGYVQGDYATYFSTGGNSTNIVTRGWIFKDYVNTKGVASISGAGHAVFNGSVTVGGNTTNTSGMRMEYDATLQCTNFIFN